MKKILYVGGFVLPDKNAAAQRVISVAKGIKHLGHDVLFLNYTNTSKASINNYFGFKTYDFSKQSKFSSLVNIKDIINIINLENITDVIAYNFPAIALAKLIKYCRKNKINIYADATEWYIADGNILFRIIKTLDTEYRMRILQKKVDGVIAISSFLHDYYSKHTKTIIIPATVDVLNPKWPEKNIVNNDIKTYVYAGTPSARKEKLKIIVDTIEELNKNHKVCIKIIGLTQNDYEKMYSTIYTGSAVSFLGKIPHEDVLRVVTNSDYSIIIRENNKVVKAGFPTKLSESITCGTPVITTDFSDVSLYINDTNGIICTINTLEDALLKSFDLNLSFDKTIFDYHNFTNDLNDFLSNFD